MNKFIKIGLAVVVIGALGVGGAKVISKTKKQKASQPKAKIYPIVVSTFSPKTENVKLTLPYLAEVANDKDVKLSSRISARVLYVKPSGSDVKKDDVLVRLDTTSIKSGIQSTKKQIQALTITLKNFENTHKRTLELLKIKGASIEESQQELNKIVATKAQISSLKQKLIELKNNLSYATIKSPVDGKVVKTFIATGSLSVPGKTLVALSSKNGFYLLLNIPSGIFVKGVICNSKQYDSIPLDSTFMGLAQYKVHVEGKKLISGDRVEVDVVIFDENATYLPFDVILNRDGKNYVLAVDGNKAKAIEINILQSGEQGVVVSDDLSGKKLVLAKPDILLRLISGYALKIKE